MAEVVGIRTLIQAPEVASSAAVSSGTATRMSQGLNRLQYAVKNDQVWNLNGTYGKTSGSQLYLDIGRSLSENMQIVGFTMFIEVAGTSGTTEIDIRRQVASGTAGSSIFTTRPAITSAAGNLVKLQVGIDPDETLHNPSGTTLPVFNTTTLDKGDFLFLDFVTRQPASESISVTLFLRTR